MAQTLKPWYQVAIPRMDLRKGVSLDASAFAIHLDQVIDGRAPEEYKNPELFFERTYMTKEYRRLAVNVLRRLNGDLVGTSPCVNLTTQFGGGKTHFLTLLYHLCRGGEAAREWAGVPELLEEAGLDTIPKARVAVFIGNRFDFVEGIGRKGEPKRRTPWGDLAWQLGGPDLYELVRKHDAEGVAPGGEILQRVFTIEPTLILMDEVLSFIRRARDAGEPYSRLVSQFYSFLDILTREVAGSTKTVLVVSLPLSEYEMTQEDVVEFQRLSKLLGRTSEAKILSEQMEIAEIVRRRLFEDVGDLKEIRRTAKAYAKWLQQNRMQIPEWFPIDRAEKVFETTYPFHPTVLSVFERKWQSLPSFQRTRGILRLLALWIMHAWQHMYPEPLITLGTAPLEDSTFRAAVFEQLGEPLLEVAVLTDIAGEEAHAVRLDQEAPQTIKRLRLHQKVATTVFFESSGGQLRNEATLPEVRLAVGGPDIEIGLIEQILDNLVERCYYLDAKGRAYWISHRPTLNKLLADRRASIAGPEAEERIREKVREAIREVFRGGLNLERLFFPESSEDIPDVPTLRLVVLAPEYGWENAERERTKQFVETMVLNYGKQGRTYKSGLIFVVAEESARLYEEARTLLALESLEDPTEQERLRLESDQVRELKEKKRRSEQTLKDLIWSAYRHVLLLESLESGKINLREVNLGLLTPGAGKSLVDVIIARLKQEGILEESVSPDFLLRHWPPAFQEGWSTKDIRDKFYAVPYFPRLLDPEALRETIARGVQEGKFGYAVKTPSKHVYFRDPNFHREQVEFSDEVMILRVEEKSRESTESQETKVKREIEEKKPLPIIQKPLAPSITYRKCSWKGELSHKQWMKFYEKILTHFVRDPSFRLHVHFEVAPKEGISENLIEEIKTALRELGLSDVIEIEGNN